MHSSALQASSLSLPCLRFYLLIYILFTLITAVFVWIHTCMANKLINEDPYCYKNHQRCFTRCLDTLEVIQTQMRPNTLMFSEIWGNTILASSFIVIFLFFISQFHSDFLSSQHFCFTKSIVFYLLFIPSFFFTYALFLLSALIL